MFGKNEVFAFTTWQPRPLQFAIQSEILPYFSVPYCHPAVFRQLLYELQMFIVFALLTGFVYEQLKNNKVLNEDCIC